MSRSRRSIPTPVNTAWNLYLARLTQIESLMEQARQARIAHTARALKDSENYGFAGDLAEVAVRLEGVIEMLGGKVAR